MPNPDAPDGLEFSFCVQSAGGERATVRVVFCENGFVKIVGSDAKGSTTNIVKWTGSAWTHEASMDSAPGHNFVYDETYWR